MYAEHPALLPHVVAWAAVAPPGGRTARVLPDGCLDIIWHDGSVFVAGPDTSTEVTTSPAGSRLTALRFAAGTGPPVLGVPADELTDRQVPLGEFWPAADVRRVADADDPAGALLAAVSSRWRDPDPAMVALCAGARAGRPVGAIADRLGLSPRQLLRRCLASFGYGPKTLTRILRLQRALGLARGGCTFAETSAQAGYADQAHLAREVRALAGVPLGQLVPHSRAA